MKPNGPINILHLSDLQAGDGCLAELPITGSDISKDLYKTYAEKIANDALNKCKVIDFIVITGDIAQKGQPPEYKKAGVFINALVKVLKTPWSNVLIVPGNHDVDRTKAKEKFGSKYQHIPTELEHTHREFIKEAKMKSFTTWVNRLYKKNKSPYKYIPSRPTIFNAHKKHKSIIFVGLDTCEHQSFQEKDNYGFIEQNQLENIPDDKQKTIIALLHHNPYHYEGEKGGLKNSEQVINALHDKGVIFALAGHMHRGRQIECEIKLSNNNSKKRTVLMTGPCCMTQKERTFNINNIIEAPKRLDATFPNRYQIIKFYPKNGNLELFFRKFTFERYDADLTIGGWTSDSDLPYSDDSGKASIDLPDEKETGEPDSFLNGKKIPNDLVWEIYTKTKQG